MTDTDKLLEGLLASFDRVAVICDSDEAQDSVIRVDPGRMVLCDFCNKDWTNSKQSGGMMFSSYAVCPDCEAEQRASIKMYKEEHLITDCPDGMSFADFIRDIVRNRR